MFGKCVGFGQCLHKRGRNGRFLWAAQNVVKWYENMGEKKNSRRAVTKSACVSSPTDDFIFIEKMVGQNLTIQAHLSKLCFENCSCPAYGE